MLKPSLQLRVGQSLSMTPQLQQAIKLLQLSSLELQQEIQQIFETNPMLEREEESPPNNLESAEKTEDASTNVPAEQDITATKEQISDELPIDSNWDDIYQASNVYNETPREPSRDVYENESGSSNSLQQHLLQQIDLINLSDVDRIVGITLIDEIDNDGYLTDGIENIHLGLVETFPELELDEVEAVLHLIQFLDPIGTGAKDLSECLSIQLRTLPADTPYLEPAIGIVKNYIDALGSRNTKLIQRRMDLSEAELQETIVLIQSLNPRPGAQISSSSPEYVVPDVSIVRRGNTWRVELNTETAPKLRINNTYADLIKRADSSTDNNYLRTQLQEARWFIKSLHSRNETLLRVATSIIEHQRKFLDYGPEAMKPLVLRDIAEELELHESICLARYNKQIYAHATWYF